MDRDASLTIEALPGKNPGTVILRLTGPLMLTNALQLRACFRDTEPAPITILDLSGVPFMDSAGMSEIINHEVYCRGLKVRMILAGVQPRVLGMLKITRLDNVLNIAANVEEADASC